MSSRTFDINIKQQPGKIPVLSLQCAHCTVTDYVPVVDHDEQKALKLLILIVCLCQQLVYNIQYAIHMMSLLFFMFISLNQYLGIYFYYLSFHYQFLTLHCGLSGLQYKAEYVLLGMEQLFGLEFEIAATVELCLSDRTTPWSSSLKHTLVHFQAFPPQV